jgi:hypothetical protein
VKEIRIYTGLNQEYTMVNSGNNSIPQKSMVDPVKT